LFHRAISNEEQRLRGYWVAAHDIRDGAQSGKKRKNRTLSYLQAATSHFILRVKNKKRDESINGERDRTHATEEEAFNNTKNKGWKIQNEVKESREP